MVVSGLACIALLGLGVQDSPTFEESVGPALAVAGLTTATARFDPGMMRLFRQGEFATTLYEVATENPWRMPFYVDVMTRDLTAQAGKPSDLLNTGGRWIGSGSRRTLIGNPIAKAVEDAKKPGALAAFAKGANLASIPAQVQEAAALILLVAADAKPMLDLAFRDVSPGDQRKFRDLIAAGDVPDDAPSGTNAMMLGFYRAVDVRYLFAGSHDLLLAVQEAVQRLAAVPPGAKFDVMLESPYGLVHLGAGANNRYLGSSGNRVFLVIDLSGDDTYVGLPSGGSMSIVIDAAGKDRYLSHEALADTPVERFAGRKVEGKRPGYGGGFGPAGALFGCAILFDLAGDDLYRSARPGLASGQFGVGVLHDAQGDDVYDGYVDSMGFGFFGAGILEDLQGDDRYVGFQQVQGMGQTGGFGALIDRGGNDAYASNGTTIDFPSAQSDKHNTSMSQGAGNGARRDYLDAHSLAGGVGVLLDTSGNDTYSCAVFGQGVGYWEGVGILRDTAGNDRYEGGWYVQGASAHFAIGYLHDSAGDDVYVATMNMAQGAGHDFGFGMLLDTAGNDSYKAPNLSLGAGNANGLGVFVESAGNDAYESSGFTLGKSGDAVVGTLRERAWTFGLFLDSVGVDTYPPALTWAKNGAKSTQWTGARRNPSEAQLGVFFDGM